MSSWDEEVFTEDVNVDFLDELAELEDEDIVEAVADACAIAVGGSAPTPEETQNARAAATIAAIWAGAPFSAGEVVASYPFIRALVGQGTDKLSEDALAVLEEVEDAYDVEPFTEALS